MQGRSCFLVLSLAFSFALAAALITPPAFASLPPSYQVQRIDSPAPQGSAGGERFGDSLVNAGDVNRDGADDILVGVSRETDVVGKVFLLSGADGSLIRTINAPPDDAGINNNVDSGDQGDTAATFGASVGIITDLGRCPGGAPGQDCPIPPLPPSPPPGADDPDQGDGIPDELVSAPGVDVDAQGDDMGMVYVIDGATGAVLKRIRMPQADRQQQATNAAPARHGPAFGRSVLSPSGQSPCPGFGGLGSCEYDPRGAVARGDLNDDPTPPGSRPDIVIGASDFSETNATSDDCFGNCSEAGRVYVYSGAALIGRSPSTPLELPLYTIKNPVARADTTEQPSYTFPEAFGYSISPIGDAGSCVIPQNQNPQAGTFCIGGDPTTGTATNQPDFKPDFVIAAPRADTFGVPESGVAFVIDGPTGRIIHVLTPPEPQQGAMFGFANYNRPAIGDVNGDTKSDIYEGAVFQDVFAKAQGRGYVLNGDIKTDGNGYSLALLDDPTPSKFGNFGTSSAGVGDVAGAEVGLNSRKEVMVGSYGPNAPCCFENVTGVISDVHIFSPLTDHVLQSIPDPDQQPDSGFGRALAPMGDLNGDGFLDFAVGAGLHDETASNQGRIYILRSYDSTGRASGGPAPPPSGPPKTSTLKARAGRTLELVASRKRVAPGRKIRLTGTLEAFANKGSCQARQSVRIQRRGRGTARYKDFNRATTNGDGKFTLKTNPRRTSVYRARVAQTSECLGATSSGQKVVVARKRKRARR